MLELTRGQITKASKKHSSNFSPKYRAFCILQNKIEEVVNNSTKFWKSIYKLTTNKDVEEGQNVDANKVEASAKEKEDKIEEKKGEEEKKDEDQKEKGEEEETQKGDQMATTKQQKQNEQSVQDTQLPPPSPPHVISTLADAIIVKDVTEKSCPNINPLIVEDLTKILDQSTQQERLCNNPVLVSVDELQNVVAESIRDKVNP